MAKTMYFAAVYDSPDEYRTTPLMMEFFFWAFIEGKYPNVVDIPYNPDNAMLLTMCPAYAVTAGMGFQYPVVGMSGFQVSSRDQAELVFGNIANSPTLIAYEVDDDNGDIKEKGRLTGLKSGPEVFAWIRGYYTSNIIPIAAATVAAAVAFKTRKQWLPRVKRLVSSR